MVAGAAGQTLEGMHPCGGSDGRPRASFTAISPRPARGLGLSITLPFSGDGTTQGGQKSSRVRGPAADSTARSLQHRGACPPVVQTLPLSHMRTSLSPAGADSHFLHCPVSQGACGAVMPQNVPRTPLAPSSCVTCCLLFFPPRVDQAVDSSPPRGETPLAPGVLQCTRYGGGDSSS